MEAPVQELITPREAGTLSGLFRRRVERTPHQAAYKSYDVLNGIWVDTTWQEMADDISRWTRALYREKLEPGDRVAIMARNSRFWVMFDQAALELALVVVPIYTEDRADNVQYILEHSGAKLLVIGGRSQWERIREKLKGVKSLKRIVAISDCGASTDRRMLDLEGWLANGDEAYRRPVLSPGDLATIVYTSGTTGRPKGVMLSHRNILSNVHSCAKTGMTDGKKIYLSFLPLSHTFERTVGYYLPMMVGAAVAHSRSIQDLPEDLVMIKPEGLISVPRIFERVYSKMKENLEKSPASRRIFELAVDVGWHRFEHSHGRARWSPKLLLWPLMKRLVSDKLMAKLGGNLKVAISGGAALSPEIARVFVGLGVPLYQGYGLTETSPVVSVNTDKQNKPASIGVPLPDVQVKTGKDDELMVKGQSVMMGYWQDQAETDRVIDREGWLHTGDKARIDEEGFIYITGRIKDIIVLANGEKVPPVDMEIAIASDPLFEQVLVIGEGRPFLSALVVLNENERKKQPAAEQDRENPGVADTQEQAANPSPVRTRVSPEEKALLARISATLHDFPGYARIYRVTVVDEPWTIDNDMLTPTLKTKRKKIQEVYAQDIQAMYEGH